MILKLIQRLTQILLNGFNLSLKLYRRGLSLLVKLVLVAQSPLHLQDQVFFDLI